MRIHTDERRTAYCRLFDTPGDVNLFIVQPGQRTCWHRHQKQTDQFRVIRGRVLIRCFAELGATPYNYTLFRPDELIEVTPGWWHGYENIGTEPAYLLMYLDKPYDAEDEERMGEDKVPWISRLTGYPEGWSDGQGSDGWGDNA